MNPHLKQLWAAMRLPENFKKSYKFFCRGLDIRVPEIMKTKVGQIVFCQDRFQLSVCSAGGHGCFEFGWIGKDPYRISNVIKLSAFR